MSLSLMKVTLSMRRLCTSIGCWFMTNCWPHFRKNRSRKKPFDTDWYCGILVSYQKAIRY